MRLLPQSEVPSDGATHIYRESHFGPCFFAAFLIAMTGGVIALGLSKGMPWFLILFALPAAAFLALVLPVACASFRRSNWLVRQHDDALYIKLRSHLNDHFPRADAVVVRLERGEIAELRRGVEKRVLPDPSEGGTITERAAWIDLVLAHGSTREIELALDRERKIVPPARFGVRTRYRQVPVDVVGPDTLRLFWRNSSTRIVPASSAALADLGTLAMRSSDSGGAIVPELDARSMHGSELDRFAARLHREGDTIRAIELMRREHNLGISEARSRLDEMVGPSAKR